MCSLGWSDRHGSRGNEVGSLQPNSVPFRGHIDHFVEGATVREIGSSGLRAISRETAGAYLKAAGIAVQPRLGTVSRGKTGQ